LAYFKNPARLLEPGVCIRKLADLGMNHVRWTGAVEGDNLLGVASDFMEQAVEFVFSATSTGTENR
jgi:hypothetical protein